MPSPDAAGTYYSQISDLMEDFYKNFFRGTVPVSKKSTTTFGMTAWDYKNTPRTYNSSEKLGTVTVSDEASLSKLFLTLLWAQAIQTQRSTFQPILFAQAFSPL